MQSCMTPSGACYRLVHIHKQVNFITSVLHPQWRQMCYYKVMAFGRTPMGRLGLRLQLLLADLFQWIALICLGVLEFLKEPRPLSLRSAPLRAKVS